MDNRIHGIKVARQAPMITYLFFVDDCLLFSRASSQEADRIMSTLNFYQISSGKVVNIDKFEVSFIQNVCEKVKDLIRVRMGVKVVTNHKRYLGLPLIFCRSEKDIFSLVVERLEENQGLEGAVSI